MTTELQAQPPASAAGPPPEALGGLVSRNIRIHGRRTSVRLEPEMWDALHEVAGLENCTVHDLCGAIHDEQQPGGSFTGALRVFLMEYYRAAAKASRQLGLVQKRLEAVRDARQTRQNTP